MLEKATVSHSEGKQNNINCSADQRNISDTIRTVSADRNSARDRSCFKKKEKEKKNGMLQAKTMDWQTQKRPEEERQTDRQRRKQTDRDRDNLFTAMLNYNVKM